MVEVLILIFLGHEEINLINDNYFFSSIPVQGSVKQVGPQGESDCTFFSCEQSKEAEVKSEVKRLSLQKGKMLSVMLL